MLKVNKSRKVCPRCHKPLYRFTDDAGKQWLAHQYTFADLMGNKKICDYTLKQMSKQVV